MNTRTKILGASLGILGLLSAGNLGHLYDSNDSVSETRVEERAEETSSGCNLGERIGNVLSGRQLEGKLGTLENDAKVLNRIGDYGLSTEDLAYVTRVVFLEGSYDRHAQNLEDYKDGFEAIAFSVLNRWNYDNEKGTHHFFGRNGDRNKLKSIMTEPGAFEAVVNYSRYLQDFEGENGDITVMANGPHFRERAKVEAAYKAVVDVLGGRVRDKTGGAVFYKADYLSDTWEGTEAFWTNGQRCNRHFTEKVNTHEFFSVIDCN
ncbi:MAG: cell wall hydrolase [Nanoarchaeota archaeon]|nr:cell wall hydrolase [Nanoarchaeota archaeon]